ncbi:S8 family peptidase [Desulfococcus multivorans]|jgi:hypothetical protein|uniref:Peptidase S8 and S53 subtilisin kexin sedolisin n=1 Tax=Desulfococcus multivorans DSM 2059 TaxID=1121405 RepID=S7UY34_DESML|nr:S8 family serine peptidase [Desulfococcus multivorans]AOY58928.1 alkaline serine protease, subtilase family protein [Desulfococcus multivorans]AQV01199.1 hypothetical protein B2D07_10755 [Desulfococcus multivorans]EPR39164.1 peptidase S8 and S53 subtilisin kexin sedolisin [Desulfococcus multivorans DSM 2059]SJZ53437.1 Subtilase family protein [Desulfococcus multivorans DSM 2059]
MKHRIVAVLLMVPAILLFAASARAVTIELSGDRISIHAEKSPLSVILSRLSASGIQIQCPPHIDPEVTATVTDKPIHEGLGAVLKPYGYVLFWERSGKNKSLRPAELHVFDSVGREENGREEREEGFAVAVNPKDGSLYVRNEILLRIAPGSDGEILRSLVSGLGGVILETDALLGIHRVRLPDGIDIPDFPAKLKAGENRLTAEPNYAYPIDFPRRFVGRAPRFESVAPQNIISDTTGVPVAVLDSGWTAGYGLEERVIAALDAVNPGMPVTDGLGHGTQMALIAAGEVRPMGTAGEDAKASPIIPIRTFDDSGITSNFALMRGIDFALSSGARVLNMSWGSETSSPFLEEALAYADNRGLIVVAAAGNKATGAPVYPAAYPTVLGIGALAPDGTPWQHSNYGSFVALSAPGYADLPVGYKGEAGIYAGTSIAAAYVANVISGWLTENPDWQKSDVMHRLRTHGLKRQNP